MLRSRTSRVRNGFRSCQRLACASGWMLGASALLACGAPETAAVLASTEQPILRGDVDTQHRQVMLLANRAGFLCTGTLIHTEKKTGFLLTAAHCAVDERADGSVVPFAASQFLVIPGTDFEQATTAFSVQAVSVEPGYDGSFALDDIAVVRFSFGSEPVPTPIPPLSASEDELALDDAVLLVGYGQTETGDENSQRRHV